VLASDFSMSASHTPLRIAVQFRYVTQGRPSAKCRCPAYRHIRTPANATLSWDGANGDCTQSL
jgi:hypothetical protein